MERDLFLKLLLIERIDQSFKFYELSTLHQQEDVGYLLFYFAEYFIKQYIAPVYIFFIVLRK